MAPRPFALVHTARVGGHTRSHSQRTVPIVVQHIFVTHASRDTPLTWLRCELHNATTSVYVQHVSKCQMSKRGRVSRPAATTCPPACTMLVLLYSTDVLARCVHIFSRDVFVSQYRCVCPCDFVICDAPTPHTFYIRDSRLQIWRAARAHGCNGIGQDHASHHPGAPQ